jgi:hypothetical protein
MTNPAIAFQNWFAKAPDKSTIFLHRDDQPEIRGSTLISGKIFCTAQRPKRVWGSASLVSSCYTGYKAVATRLDDYIFARTTRFNFQKFHSPPTQCVYVLVYFLLIFFIKPLTMDLTEGSETSEKLNLTPGKYPKENIQDSEHGENLKSRMRLRVLYVDLRTNSDYFLIKR